jgi:nucleoside-diphosphate-sugar epimerase
MDTARNSRTVHVVFGTGPLGRFTAEALLEMGHPVRLISRTGKMESPPAGAEVVAADALVPAQTRALVAGAETVYQCAQPAYHRWAAEFPPLQDAILEAASGAGAKLVAAENLYPYGDTAGRPMVETMPFSPCSRKGGVRAAMSRALFEAHAAGRVRAAAVRGSDFFGPWEPVNGRMLFRAALEGRAVSALGSLDHQHSFTYVKDFGRALATAGTDDRALGRAWHVPSGPALTQRELIDLLSKDLGRAVRARVAGRSLLGFAGLFDPTAREVVEMLYEFTGPFIIDGSAMEKTFGLHATPLEVRIRETLAWTRERASHSRRGAHA